MLFSKGRAISVLLLLQLSAWITSGQNWYQVSMTPDQEALVLQDFDGFTAYSFISPLLLVALAGIAVAALTTKTASTVSLSLSTLATFFLLFLSALNLAGANLSGVAKQIESATGIAATHGLTGVSTNILFGAYFSLGAYLLTSAFALAASWASRNWLVSAKQPRKTLNSAKTTDPISLWDEQR